MDNPTGETSTMLLQTCGYMSRSKMMKPLDTNFFLRKRYYVMIFVMIGWMMLIMLRVNLSICLVDMTSNRTYSVDNITFIKEAEFPWTSLEKGVILSSFSVGYLFSPIGGIIATKYGGTSTFGYGIMSAGIVTLLSPFLIRTHFLVYTIARFFEGVFEGISVASQGEIYVNWAPPNERTLFTSSSFTGFALGAIFTYPLAGYLTSTLNWEYTFYITGAISVIWAVIWILLVKESPDKDKLITKKEKEYFQQVEMVASSEKIIYPWKKMFTSRPLWAYLNERFVESWLASFIVYCLPLYIKGKLLHIYTLFITAILDAFNVDIEQIGWFSSIPFYVECGVRIPAAILADCLRRRNTLNRTRIHKIYILCAHIGSLLSTLILTGWTRNLLISFAAISTFRACFAISSVSYGVLPLDLAAHYSSFIMGLGTMAVSVGYILNPLVVGVTVTTHSITEWSRYFFFLCFFNVWASIIFTFNGSGTLQSWATPEEHKTKDEMMEDGKM